MKKEKTGKAEKILRDLGKSIDELITKSKSSKGDMKKELDARIKELKKNRDTLENDLKKFREKHAHEFDNLEKSLQSVADDVKDAFNRFRGKTGDKKSK